MPQRLWKRVMSETLKNVADGFSVGTVVVKFLTEFVVPGLITTLTIVWLVYRLYDLHLSVKLKEKELRGE
jgi:hypothetical protein